MPSSSERKNGGSQRSHTSNRRAPSTPSDQQYPPLPDEPIVSTQKALTTLMAIPANRSCADCRVTLVDASQVHASLSPALDGDVALDYPRTGSTAHTNFRKNHQQFAPPGATIPEAFDPPVDPAVLAASQCLSGGHGVFVCQLCGAAHKLLGSSTTQVLAVQDQTAWTPATVERLWKAGGNARARAVYEAYLDDGQHYTWAQRRPTAASEISERLTFVRAKYQALAFVLPPSGPLAAPAWKSILDLHPEWKGLWGAQLDHLEDLEVRTSTASKHPYSAAHAASSMAALTSNSTTYFRMEEPPNRLVDYFCVVTASDYCDPTWISRKHVESVASPDEFHLVPQVTDCFPVQDAHEDTEFPEHVSTFVLPEGCRPACMKEPPSFFTFVLTCANGDRLYGAVLRLYDEHKDVDTFFPQVLANSGYQGNLPSWLAAEETTGNATKDAPSVPPRRKVNRTSTSSDVVFLPKCLIILSHYPFFDLWRSFLLQIYRICLVDAPLPIERFIANFCCEIPLPPPGKIQVKFGFTVKDIWILQRPPPNQLPLSNFSFHPLFACLSVPNVMVVMALLMQETRVALISQHYALLGPVAEALLSFLFPFNWEGMYLPVMPYSVVDVLDAPVPYLVGLHSRYLTDTKPADRPHGVVFVDLDRDTVHLGWEDDSSVPRKTPALPERPAMKLKAKLEDFASCVYLQPESGKVGSLTTGEGRVIPPHSAERAGYAQVNTGEEENVARRRKVLSVVDRAYRDNELLVPISGFLSEHGQLYEREIPTSDESKKDRSGSFQNPLRFGRRHRHPESFHFDEHHQHSHRADENLMDLAEPVGFSSKEIRSAFLRFFVAVFQNYRTYLSGSDFQSQEFLASLKESDQCTAFVGHMLKTQLFDRFIEERKHNPNDPVVLLFDESINAKLNRSKKTAITHIGRAGGKKDTAFLDDTSTMITDTFSPPPPSNWGLPDDGRSYSYGAFPELDPNLFGKTRPPMQWPVNRRSSMRHARRGSLAVQAKEKAVLVKAMAPVVATPGVLYSATKRGVKNLEVAIGTLSSPFNGSPPSSPFTKINGGSPERPWARKKKDSAAARRSTDLSDITLSPSLAFNGPDVGVLSKAEEIVLNARRKQAILLGILVKLQSYCRMFLAKCLYRRLRRTQGIAASKVKRLDDDESHSPKLASLIIQRNYRGFTDRRDFAQKKAATVRIQAIARGRRARFAYRLLLDSFDTLHATARGFLTRRMLATLFRERMYSYRRQIFILWQRTHTPLSFRTKFWPLIKGRNFLSVSMAEAELRRLWIELMMPSPSSPEQSLDKQAEKALRIGRRLGISDATHVKCLLIEPLVKPGVVVFQRNITRILGDRASNQAVERAASREQQERLQIYERLNNVSSDQLLAYFVQFDVLTVQKLKKVALAEAIWRAPSQADLSVETMVVLFPELRDSTNILFTKPSVKGLRRFKSASAAPLEPLDKSMLVHTLYDEWIRRNLKEVASIGLLEMPTLVCKMISREERSFRDGVFTRQRDAAMGARGTLDWKECRLEILREFFGTLSGSLSAEETIRLKESAVGGPATAGSKHAYSQSVPSISLPGDNFWISDASSTNLRDSGVASSVRNGSSHAHSKSVPSIPLPGENFWEADSSSLSQR